LALAAPRMLREAYKASLAAVLAVDSFVCGYGRLVSILELVKVFNLAQMFTFLIKNAF
jgi:hypothetical protein